MANSLQLQLFVGVGVLTVANTLREAIPDMVHTELVGRSLGIRARTAAHLCRPIKTCVPRAVQRSCVYYMYVKFS